MFNLDEALKEWKRALHKQESFEDGTIMELESHLLDELERQKQNGLADEEAFSEAVKRIGRLEDVGGEYSRESRRSLLASLARQRSPRAVGLLLNYLKVALRNFRRHAAYSLINIMGLAIGMACSLLIVFWVRDELGYDRFHKNGQDIYRVIALGKNGNEFSSPAPFAPAVAAEVPEVVATVRVVRFGRVTFQYGKRVFYEENGIIADAALFRIFSFPVIRGDVDSAFTAPETIILSSSMARKYFGDDDPIGKTLVLEGELPLRVAGVMKDVPRRSHFRFDYVLPFKFVEAHPVYGLHWGDFNFMTYIQTKPQKNETEIIQKLNRVALAHNCVQVVNKTMTFSIQRLHDIYLNPIGPYDITLGSKTHVYLFSLIAFFIALIAGINFINLSTARAEKRAKEIGLRKVIGAERGQIVSQFFGESLLITILSLPLTLLLARIALPYFNGLTGKEFSMQLFSPDLLIALSSIAGLVGLLAGAFPALYLSAIRPIHAFRESRPSGLFGKDRVAGYGKRGVLRRILVTSQFVITITLIVATLVVGSQLRLIRGKSWHLDKDQIVTVSIKENIGLKYDLFRSELLKHPAIIGVAAKDSLPTILNSYTDAVSWDGKTQDQKRIFMETCRIDVNYFNTMGMQIVAGRGFSADFPGDVGTAYILNEQAVSKAGLTNPVGKTFALYKHRGTIVGIVKNTVFQTLRQELRPQVFFLFNDFEKENSDGTVLIRIKGGGAGMPLSSVIAHIQRAWKGINTYAPFEYNFLDQQVDAQYGAEQRLGKLFGTFALLAIFISCLGLLGLVSFVAEQRTKEIGIRRVLGASLPGIMGMLIGGFVKQVLLANLLAWPIAYFLLRKWLQGFVYRVSIGPDLLLFSGILVLLMALLTAGFQAVKAARMNPVRSLRNE
jgi:putative ABC transport system permease protein